MVGARPAPTARRARQSAPPSPPSPRAWAWTQSGPWLRVAVGRRGRWGAARGRRGENVEVALWQSAAAGTGMNGWRGPRRRRHLTAPGGCGRDTRCRPAAGAPPYPATPRAAAAWARWRVGRAPMGRPPPPAPARRGRWSRRTAGRRAGARPRLPAPPPPPPAATQGRHGLFGSAWGQRRRAAAAGTPCGRLLRAPSPAPGRGRRLKRRAARRCRQGGRVRGRHEGQQGGRAASRHACAHTGACREYRRAPGQCPAWDIAAGSACQCFTAASGARRAAPCGRHCLLAVQPCPQAPGHGTYPPLLRCGRIPSVPSLHSVAGRLLGRPAGCPAAAPSRHLKNGRWKRRRAVCCSTTFVGLRLLRRVAKWVAQGGWALLCKASLQPRSRAVQASTFAAARAGGRRGLGPSAVRKVRAHRRGAPWRPQRRTAACPCGGREGAGPGGMR
jgi:hypothetical protein